MKTLIIFDIDGTLVYSNKVDSNCFSEAYRKIYGEPFPSIDWRVYPHVTDHTIFGTVIQERFGRWPDQKEIQSFQDLFVALIQEKRKIAPEEFYEIPGAKVLIDHLIADDRFAIGIATGGWEKPAKIKLDFVEINTAPMYMGFADNNEKREDIINDAIRLAKEDHSGFARIVYVGDAIWDVRTTRNMQIPLIGIRRNGDHDVLKKEGTNIVLSNYKQLDQFMNAIENAAIPI